MYMNNDLRNQLGSEVFESHGDLCQELIDAGYALDNYYDGGNKWGDLSKVFVMIAHIRGAKSYNDYLAMFEGLKRAPEDRTVTIQQYARLTGVKSTTATTTQSARTKRYRQNQSAELAELRALRWIDDNTIDAIQYIRSKYSDLL